MFDTYFSILKHLTWIIDFKRYIMLKYHAAQVNISDILSQQSWHCFDFWFLQTFRFASVASEVGVIDFQNLILQLLIASVCFFPFHFTDNL